MIKSKLSRFHPSGDEELAIYNSRKISVILPKDKKTTATVTGNKERNCLRCFHSKIKVQQSNKKLTTSGKKV